MGQKVKKTIKQFHTESDYETKLKHLKLLKLIKLLELFVPRLLKGQYGKYNSVNYNNI